MITANHHNACNVVTPLFHTNLCHVTFHPYHYNHIVFYHVCHPFVQCISFQAYNCIHVQAYSLNYISTCILIICCILYSSVNESVYNTRLTFVYVVSTY